MTKDRTPWAVHCYEHGLVYLTENEYLIELSRPDYRWTCPECGRNAVWDDNNYESWYEDENTDSV